MRSGLHNNRIIALFVAALLLFNPPMLEVFDKGATEQVLGIPLFFAYLFFSWAIVIGCAAILMNRHYDERPPAQKKSGPIKKQGDT